MSWERVYRLVKQVPRGRVTTYGALARALKLRGGAQAEQVGELGFRLGRLVRRVGTQAQLACSTGGRAWSGRYEQGVVARIGMAQPETNLSWSRTDSRVHVTAA
jgi:6-O-methylguanine DNA methyltransferase-like protein